MNVWKVILVTLVIFATGAITGGLLARKTASEPPGRSWRQSSTNRTHQGFRPDRMLRRDFIDRARQELGLTPEQMEQIEVIVSERQARTRELWEEVSPRMRAEIKAAQEEIRGLLTPEQQTQFEELVQKRRPPRRGNWERREPGHDTTLTNAAAPSE